MDKRKIMVIVNQVAGNGKAKMYLPRIDEWCKQLSKVDRSFIDIQYTSILKPTATDLAKRAIQTGCERVIAIGGDGTFSQVAAGLVGSNVPLGLVMAGSGNDYAKALGIPLDFKQALAIAMGNNVREVDVGEINGRIFVNMVGLGFDASVASLAVNLKRRWYLLPMTVLYLVALLGKLFNKYDYPDIFLCYQQPGKCAPNMSSGKITLLSIANGPTCGGMFRLAPAANLADGYFDILRVEQAGNWRILSCIYKAIKGKHLSLPEVYKDKESGYLPRTKAVVISSLNGKAIDCHYDGEILEPQKQYLIKIIPKALKVIVP
jgi:diacylglycerol kinase (ATP)